MDPNTQRLFEAAAGGAADVLGVEDVFNTWLYTGNNSTQTITNGIDLSGEGGLVWIKGRGPTTWQHIWVDTVRGATKYLMSNASTAEQTAINTVPSFSSTGFTAGTDSQVNYTNEGFASWTFRKAPGFFDVVTWTGDGSSTGQVISHNLGSTPGFIVVKEINGTAWWTCWHRSLGGARIFLNDTSASTTANIQLYFGDGTSYVAPTDSSFTVNSNDLNQSGNTYVAYLFAHDDAQFGKNSDESIIKCGSLTGSGPGATTTVNLGWEPQWILAKRTDAAQNWVLFDNMRGLDWTNAAILYPNLNSAESVSTATGYFRPTPTGFIYGPDNFMGDTAQIIYIAIRRGPMKTPTDATDVFAIDTLGPPSPPGWNSGFVVDWKFQKTTTTTGSWETLERITGGKLFLATTLAEVTPQSGEKLDYNDGWGTSTGTNPVNYSWMFRRAPGFFDMVAYTGTGSATQAIAHNLGVTPELIIVKCRSNNSTDWAVKHDPSSSYYLQLNSNVAESGPSSATWSTTNQDSSNFYVGISAATGASGRTFIAYLFATLPGISKVGSYTGTGSTLNVDCGFTAGARFVLIKRTDSTGDWYLWDSARGITAGNDPYLLLNSTAVEVTGTNYIDTLSSGFQITSSAPAAINASGGSFIFLAVA